MEGFFKANPQDEDEYEMLEYRERGGKLYFEYRKHVSVPTQFHAGRYQVYKSEGEIPGEAVKRGDAAVKEYVTQKINADTDAQKERHERFDRFVKNPDFPVSIEHENQTLRGKIFSVDDDVLRVRLEEPFAGETLVIFNFASAMSGHRIFKNSNDPALSDYAIERARGMLIDIYRKQKHFEANREVIEMAKRLNNKANQGGS